MKVTTSNDLLSHLPAREGLSCGPWDLDKFPPFREKPLPTGSYLAELVAGGNLSEPIMFSETRSRCLKASFVLKLRGRLEQTKNGSELTKTLAGELVSLSEHAVPFKRGGSRLEIMLKALGCRIRPQSDAQHRQALTDCIGSLAVIQLTHRGSTKLDSGEYQNYGELDFDGEGEIEVYTDNGALVRGQADPKRSVATVRPHEEAAKWSRWHGAQGDRG